MKRGASETGCSLDTLKLMSLDTLKLISMTSSDKITDSFASPVRQLAH